MPKGGKQSYHYHQRPVLAKPPSPQSENSQQNESDYQSQYSDPSLSDVDQRLLRTIDGEIARQSQPLKLTWAAIYKIKQQQHTLNKQMDEQMNKIQQKYQKLKVPLIEKIGRIVTGHVEEKELYITHQETKGININKCKPEAVPQFWKQALDSLAFCSCQEDQVLLEHCINLYCNQNKTANQLTIKIHFNFNDNPIIKNTQLKIQLIKRQQQIIIKELSKIQIKSKILGQSNFIEIFENCQPKLLFNFCQEIKRIYDNSVFYYFYQANPNQEDGQDNKEDEQDNDDDDDEEEEEEEDVRKCAKPMKKKQI